MKCTDIRKKIGAFALALMMVLTMSITPIMASAAEAVDITAYEQPDASIEYVDNIEEFNAIAARSSKTYLDYTGSLGSGNTWEGSFTLDSFLGLDNGFKIYLCATNDGKTGENLDFRIQATRGDMPCDGRAYLFMTSENGWPNGTYKVYVSNYTGKAAVFSVLIVGI